MNCDTQQRPATEGLIGDLLHFANSHGRIGLKLQPDYPAPVGLVPHTSYKSDESPRAIGSNPSVAILDSEGGIEQADINIIGTHSASVL